MRKAVKHGRYASALEAKCAEALRVDGSVASFSYEPRTYPLEVNGVTISHYTPDFVCHMADGSEEVVEVKGFWRPYDKLRVKLFLALYPGVRFRVYGAPMDRRKSPRKRKGRP